MTITYTSEVGTCSGFGVFWKLLFRWKGSIYKLVWHNLVLYLVLYFSLSITYRFILNEQAKETFEHICLHCQQFSDLIPVTFVLGFYVSIVLTRWWAQYESIPWPDSCCLFISTTLHGHDDRGRLMRRTIARYLILALVQTLRLTSVPVKKRFPTLDHLVEVGVLNENEKKIWEQMDEKCIQHPKYWMPIVWAGAIVTRAKKEGRIKDDFAGKTIIDELSKFRAGCGGLLNYDWISVPLVYTQVVTLAVYTFFISSLMGRQFLDPAKKLPGHEVDMIVPMFTFLQFFFYMGWLKVAEAFINPFGEDDDDFEMNWLIDRNLQVAYLIVDEMHQEHPELVKDAFWDEGIPEELPYTAASEHFRTEPWIGSTADVEVSAEGAEFVNMEVIPEVEGADVDLNEVRVEDIKPTIPVNINNGKIASPIHSANSLHSTSVSTIPIGSIGQRRGSRESVISMIQQLFKNRGHRSELDLGSNVSVRSRSLRENSAISLRPRKNRKKNKSFSRSYSRASNLSQGNPSPSILSCVATKDNDIFKMSSMSSLNSMQMDQSELSTRRNSDSKTLQEFKEVLKNDLKHYQKKMDHGISYEPRHESDESPSNVHGTRSVQNKKQKRMTFKSEAKMLKRKLEQVQSIQRQLMKELDDEIKLSDDELDTHIDSVRTLTNQTNELRKAIQHRRHHSLSDDNHDLDPGSPISPNNEPVRLSVQHNQDALLKLLHCRNPCHEQQKVANSCTQEFPVYSNQSSVDPPSKWSSTDVLIPEVKPTYSHLSSQDQEQRPQTIPYVSVQEHSASSNPFLNTNQIHESSLSSQTNFPIQKFGLQDFVNIQPISTTDSIAGSVISNHSASSHSMNTMFPLDGNGVQNITSSTDNIVEWGVDVPSTSNTTLQNSPNREEGEFSNEVLKHDNTESVSEIFYQDTFDPSSLGTIQELPELGYSSDSSDTEFLLPKQRLKFLRTSDNSDENLPTVIEHSEEH